MILSTPATDDGALVAAVTICHEFRGGSRVVQFPAQLKPVLKVGMDLHAHAL